MIQESTIKFITQLSKNNNKAWFDKNRDTYLAAKEDFEVVIGNVLEGLTKIEPTFAEFSAKNCIYRIFRDVRFSKDKTPYKSHFGAFFCKGGKSSPAAGYYLHVEPGGKSMIGGGLWMPEAPLLKAVRQEIDYSFDEFKGIIENKQFKKYFKKVNGEQLVKLPKGYEADNPAIEFLKLKSFTVGCAIDDKDLTAKNYEKKCVEIFTAMKPFIDFLNRSLD